MAGYGSGVPLWFVCPALRRRLAGRKLPPWADLERRQHSQTRTGRTRPLSGRETGNRHPRTLSEHHEYVCTCGHRGWTKHKDILEFALERKQMMSECTCVPCESPAYGHPAFDHCAACCSGSLIEEYDHGCPLEEHRRMAALQFGVEAPLG